METDNTIKRFHIRYDNIESDDNGQVFIVREVQNEPHHYLISDGKNHAGGGRLLKKYCTRLHNTPKHTPLQIGRTLYHAGFSSYGRDWLTHIYLNNKPVFIAVGATQKESAEQAAFIVKACNNHQQLINSITDVFNHLKDPAFKSDDLNRIYCIGILETALKASE